MGTFMLARPPGCDDRSMRGLRQGDDSGGSHRKHGLRIGVASAVAEAIVLWARTGRIGGNLVVRCRGGHLYTTIWLPAASVKAVRLGIWRIQWCPVGRHFSIVTPVKETDLPMMQRRAARGHKDIRLP
jgi:hypothetical protein